MITEALQSISGKKLNLHIVAVDDDTFIAPDAEEKSLHSDAPDMKNGANKAHHKYILNPKHTFDTFIVGDSNHFASAACRAVSESPGKAYNPLFIYGGVGLGKNAPPPCHRAIRVAQDDSISKIVFVSTETFTHELITSLGDHQMAQFKEKYRNVDVLLIDDIQFLINKEKTQEEFFFTFNALYETQKQIVITSDRPPREIPTLSDRLRSRFEWGLLADIHSPDIETREAILRKKADIEKIPISTDIISYIAIKNPLQYKRT